MRTIQNRALVACNGCGGEETTLYAASPEGDRVVRCARCGLIYTNPRLRTDLTGQRLDDGDQEELAKDYGAERALYRARFDERLDWMASRLPSDARVLDIGCAWGYFLDQGRRRGLQMYGVEISPRTAAFAKQACPNVHVGELGTAPWPERFFDAATLWHTLEHLPDPSGVLRQVHRLLKPGGRLFLEVPDIGSRIAQNQKERWVHFRPLSHLYYFDRTTLGALLEKTGFICDRAEGVSQGTGWGDCLRRLGLGWATRALLAHLPGLVTAVRSRLMRSRRAETDVLIVAATRSE